MELKADLNRTMPIESEIRVFEDAKCSIGDGRPFGKRRWSVGGKTWRNKHSLLVRKLRKKKVKKRLKNRLAKSRTN